MLRLAAAVPAMPADSASAILAPVADDMRRLDALIRVRLNSDVALVRQVAEYIVAGGGKRLRPALLLLAAGAAGYRGEARLELAAVVEFIHTATLLHDDVVDESQLRRGRRTANAAFGNAASVLVGDFLYSRAFQMMVGLDSMAVMRVLADATNTIAEGEVLQLMNCHDPDVDEARYLDVVRRKTSKLFEAAARLGAMLGDVAPALEEGLAAYGMHLGTSFQVIDDVLDYSGAAEEIGKCLGDDLAEGKPTLPLIRAMRAGQAPERELVRRAIIDGGRADFASVFAAVEATGALDYARAAAEREAQAAARAIAALPPSACKDSLLELASFSVTRRS
jgi:octaprenyl-diphosphate synthase